ncbi:PAS domain S-box protein [Methanolobus sp. WCC4]|uniref:PAS domain S-box protein n=1 Tax=Methanolobus sp. WCC4 TaxID=3125784 RepID=UPI0030FA6492
MENTMNAKTNIHNHRSLALEVTAMYMIAAGLWVLFSDQILGWFVTDIDLYMKMQIYKGGVFVFATGSLLYLYLDPRIRELNESQRKLKDAETSLKKRLEYETATAESMHILLETGSVDEILTRILKAIHGTVKNSRTYIFMNEEDLELGLCMSQIAEVVSDGIETQIDNPDLQHLPYSEGAPTLLPILEAKHHFAHIVEELDDPERTILAEQGILSILLLPIFAGKEFWGFIGFDDCVETREWEENDIDLLKVIANGIGEYIIRKRSEEELRESEAKQSAMITNSTDVIAIIDENGINQYKSANVEKLFGWKPEELIGNYMWENMHPEDVDYIKAAYSVFTGTPGAIFSSEMKYRCKDGTYKWIEYTINNLLHEPAIKGILLNYHDITERKRAEDFLLESERKFRNYIESAPYGIFVIDKNGNYLEVNRTACELTGYEEDELTKMNMLDLIAAESSIRASYSFDELKITGYTSAELRFKHKDGSVFWIRRDGTRLSDTGYILFITDITEKKKVEHSLIEAKMLAEENSRIKSEFLANMSHELRTPLNSVIGFSDLLGVTIKEDITEKQLGYINHINKSGRHLLELINDILDISKIEAGKMELELERLHASEVLNEVRESVLPLAQKKNITIRIPENHNNGEIIADRLKLQQIMLNLLSNAIKFTPDNGEVSISLSKKNDKTEFSVADTGIGIPKDKQEDIFNPFTQVDASFKRKYEGTGLGLALVRQFVEMHGGEIWLESEEGKGSTFTFTINDRINE